AGAPGELYIAGDGLARGYLGKPGMTAERFVPDPFSDNGGRLYRTGDRVRWNARGEIEFLGRIDAQVKLRGFRIEPGEIEAVLRAHPAVRDAVVMMRGEGELRRLAAYVVGDAPAADALRAHAAARLPEYMVPSAFVVLDALPLTPNGKVDRRALPEPEAGEEDGYVAPSTPTEEIIAGTWADLLQVERVGATADFFLLGGHSLLATRLVSRLRESFGVEIPVRAVFEHPTVAGMAAEVERARGAASAAAPPLSAASGGGDGAPVSFAQERLWFVSGLEPESAVYHMPFAYRLRGELDAEALHRAVEEVVRRHESLRTSIPVVDGLPVQRIAAPGPVPFPLHDLRAIPAEEREAEAGRIAVAVSTAPFDLATGPLFRAALVRVEEAEHILLLALHHVVSDGWSIGVLLTELSALYGAFSRGEPSPLPELAVQYPAYAAWQRQWLSGEALEAQLAYWRGALAGAPPRLELPTDRPRPAVQSHRGGIEAALLPRDAADAVLALGRREGATLFMVLLAAMDVVLARWSGQDDVVVGTPIAGRTRRETEAMIGLFLNSLALRTDLSGDPTFRELLRRVRGTTLDAYAHQEVPFEAVLEEVKPERSLGHTPVFQVMLNLTNYGEGTAEMPGLEVEPLGSPGELLSKFDFTLYAGEGDDGVGLHLVYDADLFAPERMRELLAQIVSVLRQAVAEPAR
ncbi:MAG TPA: condensation domain-containing protein, partial [Longimicrobium sp.]|nr:condensation domain-containing protein [Longimicrobium sp.]